MTQYSVMIRKDTCFVTIKPVTSGNKIIHMTEIKFRYPVNRAIHDYDLLSREIVDYIRVYPEFRNIDPDRLYTCLHHEFRNTVKKYLYNKGLITKKELKA